MLFTAPNHKANSLAITIQGNFTDSKDSFYRFTAEDITHITFVKDTHGTIYEEARSLIFLDGIDEFFPADQPDVIYKSSYQNVSSYRRFLNKQPKFEEHAFFLKKYGHQMITEPNWSPFDMDPF
jgi:hypothetical protein